MVVRWVAILLNLELLPIIRTKVGMENASFWDEAEFKIIVRDDAKYLRTWLPQLDKQRISVTKSVLNSGERA